MILITAALRMLLEMITVFTLGYWGFRSGSGNLMKGLLAVGIPILVIVVWGTFGSPQAPYPLKGWSHLMLELSIFGSATVALWAMGLPILAGGFIIVTILNRVILSLLGY